MHPDRRAELEGVLSQMRNASSILYAMAPRSHHHAFHEFCGLINEYIVICDQTLEAGVDYTETSAHAGAAALVMHGHNRAYIAEKLECIFATSFPELIRGHVDAQP